MTFPVSQSVLDAGALADELISRYGLTGNVQCNLLSRGMNDIYRIEHDGGPHALKVARSGKSNDTEFAYEQDYVMHLAQRGIEVPSPMLLKDGSLFFSVDAPEGKRQIVMMRWLSGTPFIDAVTEDDAFRMGGFLAQLHIAAEDFATPHRKIVNTGPKVVARLPYLIAMADGQPEAQAMLQRASDTVLERLAEYYDDSLPKGACHGDLQCANVMALNAGGLAVFDFSDCGEDILAKDIAAFYWRNDFEGRSEVINQSFVKGYSSVRPLSDGERNAQPLYRVLRHLLITSSMALYVNQIGPVPGFDKNLEFYISMIRKYCIDAGIE